MRIDAIPIGTTPPDDINVVVEVAIGGEPIKYEMHKAAGTLFVDRFLYTPMRYPGNYGFVPHTLSEDGDPIDVLIANTRPIVPGAVINVRPVGVLKMEDNAGGDEKIIAVPSHHISQRYIRIENYSDLPAITLRADPALLRALQGPGTGQVGQAERLGRRRRGETPDCGGDRAGEGIGKSRDSVLSFQWRAIVPAAQEAILGAAGIVQHKRHPEPARHNRCHHEKGDQGGAA